jgi:hypothetical protein
MDVVDNAVKSARAEKKAPLVGFHASWCGYCRRLERYMASPEVKPILDKHFTAVWLTVLERGEKKALENPGAEELFVKWSGGLRTGLPFLAVLDKKGNVIGSSLRPVPGKPGENIGYPATPEEVGHFLSILEAAAPGLTNTEVEILRKNLVPPPVAR